MSTNYQEIMDVSFHIYVPFRFQEAYAYVSGIVSRHGFVPIVPRLGTTRVHIQTADGLGDIAELHPEEVQQNLRLDKLTAIQFWHGDADILVSWRMRQNGWNFLISTISWNKEAFDLVVKDLFADALERFHQNVDDAPTVELLFD